VSVHGEFQRLLADLAAFLSATGDSASVASALDLEACALTARKDLSGAARRVLEVCAAATSEGLSELQAKEYSERAEHLDAICRSLLG
jgi:hypothetical protein